MTDLDGMEWRYYFALVLMALSIFSLALLKQCFPSPFTVNPVMSALPWTQVLNSSTFKAPPLEDKCLCLPDFYDWQAQNSPNHPFFLYGDGPEKVRTIPWAEAVRGIHRAAHLVASRVSPEDAAAGLEGRPVIVAALAATGLCPTLPSVVSMLTPLTAL